VAESQGTATVATVAAVGELCLVRTAAVTAAAAAAAL